MKSRIFILMLLSVVVCLCFLKKSYYHFFVTKKIVAVFKKYMLTEDIDKKSIDFADNNLSEEITGFDELFNKIDYFVCRDEPLALSMVGFPYKSSNTRDKVLVSRADAAEDYSLRYVQSFLNDIKKCYSPGVQLYIFTDGLVFCDIEKVLDEDVIMYEDDLKKISRSLSDIIIVTLRDIYPDKTPAEIRSLISDIEPNSESFNAMIVADTKLCNDVDVLTDRMKFELALLSFSDDEVYSIALHETRRSLQLSSLLKQFRSPETIVCSVHYQKNVGKKCGLKLSNSCVTPWHGILVEEDDGKVIIMHKKDVNLPLYLHAYKRIHGLDLLYLKKI